MKTPKCPLCGAPFEYYEEEYYCFCQCSACLLACEGDVTIADAWKNVEQLISKFPPVMRIHPGDKLIYFNNMYHRQGGIVMGRDPITMRIQLEDGSTTPEMVIKWPWELEQKEENETDA